LSRASKVPATLRRVLYVLPSWEGQGGAATAKCGALACSIAGSCARSSKKKQARPANAYRAHAGAARVGDGACLEREREVEVS